MEKSVPDWSNVPGVRFAPDESRTRRETETASVRKRTAGRQAWEASLILGLTEQNFRRRNYVPLREWLGKRFDSVDEGLTWWQKHVVGRVRVRRQRVYLLSAKAPVLLVREFDAERVYWRVRAREASGWGRGECRPGPSWVRTTEACRMLGKATFGPERALARAILRRNCRYRMTYGKYKFTEKEWLRSDVQAVAERNGRLERFAPDEVFSASQLERVMGVTRSSIQRWATSGVLAGKLGMRSGRLRELCFTRAAVERFFVHLLEVQVKEIETLRERLERYAAFRL